MVSAKEARVNELDRRDWMYAVRIYPNSTLVFDHKNEVVKIQTDGEDTPAFIFGSLGKKLCKLANGTTTCSMEFMKDRVKAFESN